MIFVVVLLFFMVSAYLCMTANHSFSLTLYTQSGGHILSHVIKQVLSVCVFFLKWKTKLCV